MSCDKCKETSCIGLANIGPLNGKDKEYFANIRYDFDDINRNELDMELGYILFKDNNSEVYADWSYSFNTNYCPFCGEKQDKQIDVSYNDLEHDAKGRYVLINFTFKNEKATLYLNLEEKRLEVELYVNDVLLTTSYVYIRYSPIDGRDLYKKEVDPEIVGCIMDVFEDFMASNVIYISHEALSSDMPVFLKEEKYDDVANKITEILACKE